jgi:hypothetical protein
MSADRDEILALVAALAAELQAEREHVAALTGTVMRANERIAELTGMVTELSVAQGVELTKQLLANEQFRRADAALAAQLGGVLVEVAPSPQPRPKPRARLKLAVDNTTKPKKGGA